MKIVADNKIPYLKGALEPHAEMVYLPGAKIGPGDVKDADALITRTRTKCNKELLEGSRVKFIATATIGHDHIDKAYCQAAGIEWTNAPGCNAASVRQYIASCLLILAESKGFDLREKTIGIVGVGEVGTKVVELADWLGISVLLNDPPREREEGPTAFVSLDGIIESSDIISLHVPLNREGADKTFHLFDEGELNKLSRHVYLINSSRGAVIDNQALKKALHANALSGCILDVWENEPALDQELLQKVFLGTPHVAGYSADGKANGTAMSVQAVGRFFHLGLEDWYPGNVPVPAPSLIPLDGKGKSHQQILREAVLASYNVREDHERLARDPGGFEGQRGNYPLRREFQAYTLKLTNVPHDTISTLEKFGFKIHV